MHPAADRAARHRQRRAPNSSLVHAVTAFGSPLSVIPLHDLGRNTATLADLEALLLGPLADGLVLLPVGGSSATATASSALARSTAELAASANIRGHRIPELGRVLRREIDLVRRAIECECNRLLGLATVEIIDQGDLNLLRHFGYLLESSLICGERILE